jgi:hypothetical protein
MSKPSDQLLALPWRQRDFRVDADALFKQGSYVRTRHYLGVPQPVIQCYRDYNRYTGKHGWFVMIATAGGMVSGWYANDEVLREFTPMEGDRQPWWGRADWFFNEKGECKLPL